MNEAIARMLTAARARLCPPRRTDRCELYISSELGGVYEYVAGSPPRLMAAWDLEEAKAP